MTPLYGIGGGTPRWAGWAQAEGVAQSHIATTPTTETTQAMWVASVVRTGYVGRTIHLLGEVAPALDVHHPVLL